MVYVGKVKRYYMVMTLFFRELESENARARHGMKFKIYDSIHGVVCCAAAGGKNVI